MKNYQRAAGNELDTFLLRNSILKKHPEFFTEVRDVEGNILNPKEIKRINEMTGAGIEYTTSLIEYICTHHKDFIKKTDSNLYYETEPIEWAAALDIMTGGMTGQRNRAAKELLRLHASPKPVLIKCKGNFVVSMQPFILVFYWGRPETLDARTAANLAKMRKGAEELAKKREVIAAKREHRQIDIENMEYYDLLPIENISIQFSKLLFEDLMIERGNTYSFPTGMYAKMFHYAQSYLSRFSQINDPQISAFARFARYIMRHNNLTARQTKNKDHRSSLKISLLEIVSEVYPSAISINGRGERRVEIQKIKAFLDIALSIYYCIDNFFLYPVMLRLTQKTLTIDVYRDKGNAEKALGLCRA